MQGRRRLVCTVRVVTVFLFIGLKKKVSPSGQEAHVAPVMTDFSQSVFGHRVLPAKFCV